MPRTSNKGESMKLSFEELDEKVIRIYAEYKAMVMNPDRTEEETPSALYGAYLDAKSSAIESAGWSRPEYEQFAAATIDAATIDTDSAGSGLATESAS